MPGNFRKPLVIMSPKSLLRFKLAVSALSDLTDGRFQLVIDEVDPLPREQVQRVLLCSGKVYYALLTGRAERNLDSVAILRVEQLYPFPGADITARLAQYPHACDV